MSLFNLPVTHKERVKSHHPWEKTVKDIFANKIKHVHNSLDNPHCAPKKEKVPYRNRVQFTVSGNRVTKEFIYCANLVKGLHKYRWKRFDAPVIRGVTGVEWPRVWNEIKLQYGGLAFCIQGQVVVLCNNQVVGDHRGLAEMIANKYCYPLYLNYEKESVAQFLGYVKSSARPCVFMHISMAEEHVGTLIFMLYADSVPNTCTNFLRLCQDTRGGYSGAPVHRVVKGCWVQCGGFGLRSAELGCENFTVPLDRRGVLAMANDGRHVDCSTQFFVLLQPMPWMQHKYVAFGQLVDGESVLRKIESVPTWYEAPITKIVIHKAGLLNLDCQDIRINPMANEYIQGHVENLVTIGELFLAILMEQVYLEIEFRRIQRLEPPLEECGEEERIKRATQRFNRKREDMQQQLEKVIVDTMESHRSSPAGGSRGRGRDRSDLELDGNDQFDVEEYTYEPEEPSYRPQVSAASSPPRAEVPFYLPLADVPYPGEVDSNYDLKKFIRGDYCLESDLTKKPALERKKKISVYKSDECLHEHNVFYSADTDDEQVELDSNEENEIKRYLKNNLDRVSFAGGVVKSIAKAQEGMLNLFQNSRKSELITDDQLRRVSLKVIGAPDEQSHSARHRRPTAFIHPSELLKLRFNEEDDDDDGENMGDEDNKDGEDIVGEENKGNEENKDIEEHKDREDKKEGEDESNKVRIELPGDEATAPLHPFHRRPTAFVPLGTFKFNFDDEDDEDDDDGKPDDDKMKVCVAVQDTAVPPEEAPTIVTKVDADDDDLDDDVHGDHNVRPSLIARLYEDNMFDDDEAGPTLKNYKPLSEMQRHNVLLLTHSPTNPIMYEKEERPKYTYFRPSIQMEDSYGQLNIQHANNVVRKISSDYVNTIKQMERQTLGIERSIRGVEYAKTRPAMSVGEYQRRNLKYQEEHKNTSNEPFACPGKHKQTGHKTGQVKNRGRGIRLPGDSPLYSHQSVTTIYDQKPTFN